MGGFFSSFMTMFRYQGSTRRASSNRQSQTRRNSSRTHTESHVSTRRSLFSSMFPTKSRHVNNSPSSSYIKASTSPRVMNRIPTYNELIAERIAPIFGFSDSDAVAFMNTLHTHKPIMPFYEKLSRLPKKLNYKSSHKSVIYINERSVPPKYIYKVIHIDTTHHYLVGAHIRNILMEAFIQAVLCTDSEAGKYICKLFHVYRDTTKIILQLEYLETTLQEYIEQPITPTVHRLIIDTFLPSLYKAFTILNRKYKFKHNDIHLGNFMIHDEAIKIIDFGYSKIRINKSIYATQFSKKDETYKSKQHTNLYNTVDALGAKIGNRIFNKEYGLLKITADTGSDEFLSVLQASSKRI